MRNGTKRILTLALCCLVVMAMTVVGLVVNVEGRRGEETKVSLTAEQVIASVKTAVAVKPGNVLEVEAEKENGRTVCEVEVLAQDGKTYEVVVDVASNTVLKVELDDDADDKDGDDDK